MNHFGTFVGWVVLLAPSVATAASVGSSGVKPKAAVVSPISSAAIEKGFSGAVERVVRARIDELKIVDSASTPALSLPELQLAVGCVGETRECLKAVADQLEVTQLVLTNIDRTEKEVVVSMALFDVRKGADPKRAVRRTSGSAAESAMLDEIDGMLRELYGLPPAPKKPVAVDEGVPVAPMIVAGTGAVIAGVGGIFGLLARGGQSDYESAPVHSRAEVDHAIELRESAEGKATVANVLFVIGAAGIATGAVMYFWPGDRDSRLALAGFADAEGGGVVLGGSW